MVGVGRRGAAGRDCEAPLTLRSVEEQSGKKNKIKFKSRFKNTAAVNQSGGKGTAVFLADEGSKSCVSIYNYSLLKPVSVSLQLCSVVLTPA